MFRGKFTLFLPSGNKAVIYVIQVMTKITVKLLQQVFLILI